MLLEFHQSVQNSDNRKSSSSLIASSRTLHQGPCSETSARVELPTKPPPPPRIIAEAWLGNRDSTLVTKWYYLINLDRQYAFLEIIYSWNCVVIDYGWWFRVDCTTLIWVPTDGPLRWQLTWVSRSQMMRSLSWPLSLGISSSSLLRRWCCITFHALADLSVVWTENSKPLF
jgi:hypothetical protein